MQGVGVSQRSTPEQGVFPKRSTMRGFTCLSACQGLSLAKARLKPGLCFLGPSGPAVWTFARPSTALDRGYSGSGRGSLNHGGVADHIGWRAPTCL
ncbi:MAG: hypothetical protein QOI53_1424, partial [Verrucomicrobiota bacterium]|nr:hypothetical protein [Verrucomicrobiota bacterium]